MGQAQSLLSFPLSTENQDLPQGAQSSAMYPHCRLWGKPGGPNWAGRPATGTPGSCPWASATASAAAMPSCAAAAACRMLITGTMRQRKSGRSRTMSGPQGLSPAKRDGGRSWGAASALLPPLREPLSLWLGPGKTGNYSKPITPRRDLLVSPGAEE